MTSSEEITKIRKRLEDATEADFKKFAHNKRVALQKAHTKILD